METRTASSAGLSGRPEPWVMGILNVTPDSFSDGGRFLPRESALAHARDMAAAGADIIDVGGESTRPGAKPVGEQEELDRVCPVVEAVARNCAVRVSVDTRRARVAREALRVGATIVNDVTGGGDPEMAAVVAASPADVVLMHLQGTPETMQLDPSYPQGVVVEVKEHLEDRVRRFEEAGVPRSRVWIDPGIGFGKTLEHNLQLLRNLAALDGIGARLLVGTSRKSFLARILRDPQLPFEDREPGTIASCLWAYTRGASVFRVHDVPAFRRALATWEAIRHAP